MSHTCMYPIRVCIPYNLPFHCIFPWCPIALSTKTCRLTMSSSKIMPGLQPITALNYNVKPERIKPKKHHHHHHHHHHRIISCVICVLYTHMYFMHEYRDTNTKTPYNSTNHSYLSLSLFFSSLQGTQSQSDFFNCFFYSHISPFSSTIDFPHICRRMTYIPISHACRTYFTMFFLHVPPTMPHLSLIFAQFPM